MVTPSDGAAATAGGKKLLTRDEFEQICFEAAKESTNSEAYLSDVVAKVILRLGIKHTCVPQNSEADVENLQMTIVSLYYLLNEEIHCDFDVSEVLNLYSVGLSESA
jgi:hypothetical protein